jgi:hypothetical protein
VTIQGNLINKNTQSGIEGGNAIIESNTITNNRVGVHNPAGGTIHNNNIVGNTVNSVTASSPSIDASNNWWGTTDLYTINQTIYDQADDPQWGKVTFTPILTGPNTNAPAIPDGTVNPNVTPAPSSEPTNPTWTPRPTPAYTPMPTVNYGQIKNNSNQDRSIFNLNVLVVGVAVLLAIVWAVVLLGYRLKSKLSAIRRN